MPFQSQELWCCSFSIQSRCWYLINSTVVVSPGGWMRTQLCELYLLCFRLLLTCHLLSVSCCCRLYLLQFTGVSCHIHLVQQALFI
jgi:hypothetical protein